MSDVFEGPGWWMASDGKWYAPERHPDPAYRERFLTPEPIVEPEATHTCLLYTSPSPRDA